MRWGSEGLVVERLVVERLVVERLVVERLVVERLTVLGRWVGFVTVSGVLGEMGVTELCMGCGQSSSSSSLSIPDRSLKSSSLPSMIGSLGSSSSRSSSDLSSSDLSSKLSAKSPPSVPSNSSSTSSAVIVQCLLAIFPTYYVIEACKYCFDYCCYNVCDYCGLPVAYSLKRCLSKKVQLHPQVRSTPSEVQSVLMIVVGW